MKSKEWLNQRKAELLDRLRPHDPEAVFELEALLELEHAADSNRAAGGREFEGLENITAAEKYLRRAKRATLDEMAEAMWEGGMRPPQSVYDEGSVTTEESARHWVTWRFKQAVSRHISSSSQSKFRRDKGFILLTEK